MIPAVSLFRRTLVTLPLVMPLLISGCGGNYNPDASGQPGNNNVKTGLQLSVPVQPTVTYTGDGTGTTRVIMQFSVKDNAGLPLGADEFDVQLLRDDRPVDVESLLSQSSEELKVNLYFGMVLDASYSMTQHNPPAFEPMKSAARDSYQEVLDLWKNRQGDVKFSMVWFDSVLNQTQYDPATLRSWLPDDILDIPTPQTGNFTKLYSSVEVMAKYMKSEYDKGVFNGPRDQYVMLVFSDGADNYSWFDNSSQPNQLMVTKHGASYRQFGTTAPASKSETDALKQATSAIASHPRLTTHVIGLGSDINADELKKIASAGHGVFQSNPSSDSVAALFQRVMKEFTTLQTRGAEIPLAPGDYKITLLVTNKATGDAGRYSFTIHAGDAGAKVISVP